MTRFRLIFTLMLCCSATYLFADNTDRDSLKVVDIEEVVVIATPKENKKLKELPASVSLISNKEMQSRGITNIKDITSNVPNIYIPDYGSKLTSAVYIRGIGSRVNTPSVGLYVDNIPFIEKASFDFSFDDIERIAIFRGPQGTLYGRNTMGGLIKVYTKSPLTYQGTDLKLRLGNYGTYMLSAKHYHKINDKFAFSAGAFYDATGGYFVNKFKDNERIGKGRNIGARIRAIYQHSPRLKFDLSINGEYNNHNAYPYIYNGRVEGEEETNKDGIGFIAYNDESAYKRGMMNAGLNIEYIADKYVLTSTTGFQTLKDKMSIDQDFTAKEIYTLTQRQKSNSISQEVVLKATKDKRWQWAFGGFAYYQSLNTEAPVGIHNYGLNELMTKSANRVFNGLASSPAIPLMHMNITTDKLNILSDFRTPTLNTGIYHQSTIKDLLTKGLSLTAGVRLDYEKLYINYQSISDQLLFDFDITQGGHTHSIKNLKGNAQTDGQKQDAYLQLLPKLSIQYEWAKGNSAYISVSKGYRSGGYNVQMLSDVIASKLKNSMIGSLQEGMGRISPLYKSYSERLSYMKDIVTDIDKAIMYKPEHSYNYEMGIHLSLLDNRILADGSIFYMATKDQQISQFAPNGLGRTIVNAGKSHSYGIEAEIKAMIIENLSLSLAYGHTQARFTDHIIYRENQMGGKTEQDNYTGNYVPFVPKHTLSTEIGYTIPINKKWIERINLSTNLQGIGEIYWDEANTTKQPFYAMLNTRAELQAKRFKLSFWVRNITDTQYSAFHFHSFKNSFSQQGRPRTLGIDLNITL